VSFLLLFAGEEEQDVRRERMEKRRE